MGILDLLLPPGQQVSDKEVSKRKLVSGREIQSGMPMRENLKEDTSTTSQILYQQYLMEKLGNYSDPGKGGFYVLQGGDQGRRFHQQGGGRTADRRAAVPGESLPLSARAADHYLHEQI